MILKTLSQAGNNNKTCKFCVKGKASPDFAFFQYVLVAYLKSSLCRRLSTGVARQKSLKNYARISSRVYELRLRLRPTVHC